MTRGKNVGKKVEQTFITFLTSRLQLNDLTAGVQPLLMLLVPLVPFLLQQAKMSAVEKGNELDCLGNNKETSALKLARLFWLANFIQEVK